MSMNRAALNKYMYTTCCVDRSNLLLKSSVNEMQIGITKHMQIDIKETLLQTETACQEVQWNVDWIMAARISCTMQQCCRNVIMS